MNAEPFGADTDVHPSVDGGASNSDMHLGMHDVNTQWNGTSVAYEYDMCRASEVNYGYEEFDVNQFSLRKLLEGDWGSAITVCPKKRKIPDTYLKVLGDFFVVLKVRHRDVDGATTCSKSRCLMSINLKEVKIQKISVLCVNDRHA